MSAFFFWRENTSEQAILEDNNEKKRSQQKVKMERWYSEKEWKVCVGSKNVVERHDFSVGARRTQWGYIIVWVGNPYNDIFFFKVGGSPLGSRFSGQKNINLKDLIYKEKKATFILLTRIFFFRQCKMGDIFYTIPGWLFHIQHPIMLPQSMSILYYKEEVTFSNINHVYPTHRSIRVTHSHTYPGDYLIQVSRSDIFQTTTTYNNRVTTLYEYPGQTVIYYPGDYPIRVSGSNVHIVSGSQSYILSGSQSHILSGWVPYTSIRVKRSYTYPGDYPIRVSGSNVHILSGWVPYTSILVTRSYSIRVTSIPVRCLSGWDAPNP